MTGALEMTRHVLLLGTAVACCYTDMAKGKLYNGVTLTALVLGLAVSVAADLHVGGYRNIVASALACGVGGGLLLLVYLFGGLGGGDVKTMAAVGALSASWRLTLIATFYAAVVGAIWAVGLLIWEGRLLAGLKRSGRLLVTFGRRRGPKGSDPAEAPAPTTIPYGVAIALGTIAAWFEFYVAM